MLLLLGVLLLAGFTTALHHNFLTCAVYALLLLAVAAPRVQLEVDDASEARVAAAGAPCVASAAAKWHAARVRALACTS
jgi:hypothetical protein